MISDQYEPPYSVKILKNYVNRETRDYIDYLINNRTFIPATQTLGGIAQVQTQHKIRLDYTLQKEECGFIDEPLVGASQSGCNLRERWRILFYDGAQSSFRDEHTDWTSSSCHRRMSIVIALSDPSEYEGGELVFKDLNLRVKLPKNAAVVFDARLVHEVTPVTGGKRYVLQCFMFDESGWKLRTSSLPKSEFTLVPRKVDPKIYSPPEWETHENSNAMSGKISNRGRHFLGSFEKLEDVIKMLNTRADVDIFTWIKPDYQNRLWAGKAYVWTLEEAKDCGREDDSNWSKETGIISGIVKKKKVVNG